MRIGMHNKLRASSRGFTLVELLVVLVVVAILAAILFPVLSMAKSAGQTASCQSNLTQVGRALQMYRDDHQGRNVGQWNTGITEEQSWFFAVQKYVATRMSKGTGSAENVGRYNVFKCPSAPWLKQKFGNATVQYKTEGFAYAMNETGWSDGSHGCMHTGGTSWKPAGLTDAQFRRPSQTIWVFDCMGWRPFGTGYDGSTPINNEKGQGGMFSPNPSPDENIPFCEPGTSIGPKGGPMSKMYNIRLSHGGGCNCLFYDGHIKLLKQCKGSNLSVYY